MPPINNEPAFPSQSCGSDGLPDMSANPGMSLRDWFAGQVLASAAALPSGEADCAYRARSAYQQADAMLAARATKEDRS